MKKHRRISIYMITMMLTVALLPFSSVFAEEAGQTGNGGTTAAPAEAAAPARAPVLLMVDNRKDNKRVVREFKKVGVKVVTVYDIDLVDPSKYDGLIIPGGHNIDPRMYNAKRSKHTYGTNIKKDRLQVESVKRFAEAGKPVLGLCRGCQVINVAFGGTIKQHIKWHKGFRKVKNVKGYWMYQMYGAKRKTYHYHHQCVKKLGKGLVATSYDTKSKKIESIQHVSLPVYGVQWHPDCKTNKQGNKLFREFKKIVEDNMKARGN